jgi:hypothetical protein
LIPVLNKASGLIELVDPISGNVVRIQRTKERLLEEDELVQVTLPDGRIIWAEKSVNLDKIPGVHGGWVYSDIIAGLICQKIVDDGFTLKKVCELPNMPPYSIVCIWRRAKPEFAKMLLEARKDWAEYQHDKALELIDNVAEAQDAIAKAKAQVDFRKWSAERAAPETFGTKKENGAAGGTVIVINTGILRQGDAGYRDVTPPGLEIEGLKNEGSNNSKNDSGQIGNNSGSESTTFSNGVVSIKSNSSVGPK